MLVILDGFGWREEVADNAVRQAKTPTFARLWEAGPHGFLHTSGKDVGLPVGQMGNSEVGHLNIGAGRVVMQDLPRIGEAIASGEINRAPALTDPIKKLKDSLQRAQTDEQIAQYITKLESTIGTSVNEVAFAQVTGANN